VTELTITVLDWNIGSALVGLLMLPNERYYKVNFLIIKPTAPNLVSGHDPSE